MATNTFMSGQCTHYCWERAHASGNTLEFSRNFNRDAALWWDLVTNYTQSQTPTKNSIVVWTGGADGYGHVAFVTSVNNNGSFVIYESNLKSDGKITGPTTLTKQDRGTIKFKGFLQPPAPPKNVVTDFVTQLYQNILGRSPDTIGLEHWSNYIITGQKTAKEVAYGLAFSTEFSEQKHSSESFATIMYRAMLGRQPDKKGLEHWVNYLSTGKSRTYVFNGFADSEEFKNISNKF